jgi:hypothetical protein
VLHDYTSDRPPHPREVECEAQHVARSFSAIGVIAERERMDGNSKLATAVHQFAIAWGDQVRIPAPRAHLRQQVHQALLGPAGLSELIDKQ